MKAVLIRNMPKLKRLANGKTIRIPDAYKTGDEIDDANAYMLVRQGCAEPGDEECREAAGLTPEQMSNAQKSYERLSKGIDPEDYQAYEWGWMIGYKPDGEEGDTWIPGPNWVEGCEDEYYSEQEAEDE